MCAKSSTKDENKFKEERNAEPPKGVEFSSDGSGSTALNPDDGTTPVGINGAPITSVSQIFMYYTNLTVAPKIPNTVVSLNRAFFWDVRV